MVNINPQKLTGNWTKGFALDIHTLSSTFVGYDEFGHEVFDTKRSELGELLYRLKYGADQSVLNNIVDTVVDYLTNSWRIVQSLNLIVPVPPSDTNRRSQPVLEVARGIGSRTKIPVLEDALVKVKQTLQLKNVYDYQKRAELLSGAFTSQASLVQGKTVLLLDDLYRSGATLNAVSRVLRDEGHIAAIYVLALTKTRSKT
ncbi:MAG: hypothetical protein DDT26_00864 [Dehalococcoidia bacterium]|nr:hypothetical protein [Chloroflexota bacterium]